MSTRYTKGSGKLPFVFFLQPVVKAPAVEPFSTFTSECSSLPYFIAMTFSLN